MGYKSLEALVQDLLKYGLATPAQIEECREELNGRKAAPGELLALLVRKGYVTTLQRERIDKGEIASLVIGGYLMKYKIASGSFGRVYRGEFPQTGQGVAIKILRERWSNDPKTIDLFQREGKVGMTLHHENIVQILAVDWDRATNRYFMVMEFVQGGNLREILTSHRKLSPAKALTYLEGAVAGLAHAFSRGLTHRDIKMSNILISMDGAAKLVDFGLAGMMASRQREDLLNGQVEVERTIEYAGLEKATGVQPGDTRSDIFFLGCVTYEMLTGKAPLRKPRDRNDRMNANRFSQAPQLTREDVKAPQSLYHLVSTMMAFNPRQRYQTPWQLLEAVKAARRDLTSANDLSSDHSLGQRTIFVVEGKEAIQECLRERLPKLGYRLRMASHPASALEHYRQQPFDAILIDVATAKQEGLLVFEQILAEAERRSRSCAALLVLSPKQAGWRARVPARANVAVLEGPVSVDGLLNKLKELVPPPPPKSAEKK